MGLTLSSDDLSKGPGFSSEVSEPSAQQIKDAIVRLDGVERTVVTIDAEDEGYLSIGGGRDGRYIVSGTTNDYTFHNLVEPGTQNDDASGADVTVTMIVGGQLVSYSAAECVDYASAVKAAQTFASRREFDSDLTWQER